MGKMTKELVDKLSYFLTTEIQSRALDGITYAMVFKGPKDKETLESYMEIKKEVEKCGFGPNEVFRVYEVSNGYIFDLDLSVAKSITVKLSEVVNKMNNGQTPIGDLIGSHPENRRKEDMSKLAKLIKNEFKEGKRRIEIALFSRNSVPRIVMSADDKKSGKPVLVKYDAFAIRHWDLGDINTKMLIPAGIRIVKIEPGEILPPKTGVRFVLHLAEA